MSVALTASRRSNATRSASRIEIGEARPQGEERRGGFLRLDAADPLEGAHGIEPGRRFEQQLACQRRAVERT